MVRKIINLFCVYVWINNIKYIKCRMERDTLFFILDLIRNYLETLEGPGRPSLLPELQLYVAIWYMATPDSYR